MEHPVTDSLIMPLFVQGAYTFLTAYLCMKLLTSADVRIKFFLGVLMAFLTLCNLKDLIIYHLPYLDVMLQQVDWITVTDSLTVPLCGIFLLELIKPQSVNVFKAVAHLFPFAVFLVIYCVNFDSDVIDTTLAVASAYSLLVIVRVIYFCKTTPPYRCKMLIYRVLMCFIALAGVWVGSCAILGMYSDILFYVVSGLALYTIYHSVNRYVNEYDAIPLSHVVYAKESSCQYPFVGNFNKLIYDDCVYLNPNITIKEVARLIGTNRSYLSEYLNNNCNSSFPDFMNNLRLDYAENIMKDDCAMSIEAVSAASGFNSLQTFRRSFVKRHGITPSQYRQKNGLI